MSDGCMMRRSSYYAGKTRGRWLRMFAIPMVVVVAASLCGAADSTNMVAPALGKPSLQVVAQYGDSFLRHDDTVWSVDFSPDGTLLATGCNDGKVSLWDLRSVRKVRDIVVCERGAVYCVRFVGGDKLLTSSAPVFGEPCESAERAPEIALWNLADGARIRTFDKPTYKCHFLRLFDRGRKVIGGGQWGEGGDISIWDMESGKKLRTFSGDVGKVHSIAVSPDESLVLTGDQNSRDNSARLWSFREGNVIHAFPKSEANSTVWTVAFSADGRYLAYPSPVPDEKVVIWDVEKRANLHALTLAPPVNVGSLNGMVFSTNSKTLYCSGLDGVMLAIDLATGAVTGGTHRVDSLLDLVMSSDGSRLAAGSFGSAAWVVDVATLEADTFGLKRLAYAGRTAVTRRVQEPSVAALLNGDQMMVVDVADITNPLVYTNELSGGWSLAQGDDLIVGCSYEGHAWAWDRKAGKQVAGFQLPEGSILVPMSNGVLGAINRGELYHADARKGQVRSVLRFKQETQANPIPAHSPGGAYVTRRLSEETVELWDLRAATRVLSANARSSSPHFDLSIVSGDGRHYIVIVFPGENRMESHYFRMGKGAEEGRGKAAALVSELGHATSAVRERAHRELLALGSAAMPTLRSALTNDDPEVITRVTEIVAVMEKTDAGVKPDDVRALDARGEPTGIGFFPDSSRWFLSTRSQILLMEADGESGAMKKLAALQLPKPVVQLHLVGRDRFLAFNCDTTVTLYRFEW